MLEVFQYGFMQRALVAAVLIGTVTALIGTYVVLRGLAFIGAGIAHSSFGGVALGLLMGWNPVWIAVGFALAVGIAIATLTEKGRLKEDTAIGIFFASTMALGVLLLGFIQGYTLDLFSYLFGNVLAVTAEDLWISGGMVAVVLALLTLFYKEFLALTFDPEYARVQGFWVSGLNLLLILLLVLTVVLSLKVVGIILVSAMLVIPAATAQQLAQDFRQMQGLAVLFGLISSVGGLLLSYWWNTPSGATIVLLAAALFFLVWGGRHLRRR